MSSAVCSVRVSGDAMRASTVLSLYVLSPLSIRHWCTSFACAAPFSDSRVSHNPASTNLGENQGTSFMRSFISVVPWRIKMILLSRGGGAEVEAVEAMRSCKPL
eukprot:CAMPEP_0173371958 /NCGR_PEP_ID=MMETSP1144-20121109/27590_1 /TAXON_ID=483371 /ORGANISM="non described non described, Strain CCMP2298" /LENGTH=103 /DNA_ID=CAMNT_0014323797 /DNA_START=503 /DNA_END=811 /DNA_ORIENTATION=-